MRRATVFSNKPGSTASSRVFIYLGLAVIAFLLLYQLRLNHDSLRSITSWKVGSAAITTYDPDTGDDAGDWVSAALNSTVQSKTSAMQQVNPTRKPVADALADGSIPTPDYSAIPILPTPNEKELVIAAMRKSDMSWVKDFVSPDWILNIFRADIPAGEAEFTVPENKGNEAMVYLTYIIDRYGTLPDVTLFVHGGRYQWHNDNPLYDSVISINALQIDHVRNTGYVNLRCSWMIGCPAELEPARYLRESPDDQSHPTAMEFPHSFMELFPGTEVPELVGVPCCSQFAVSRETIRARGKEDYVHMRDWLLASPLDASTSGRIFEYSWHIMFGKTSQFCVDPAGCYCNIYGYCNMTEDELRNQWVFKGVTLPEGWPAKGWPEPEPQPQN